MGQLSVRGWDRQWVRADSWLNLSLGAAVAFVHLPLTCTSVRDFAVLRVEFLPRGIA